MIDEKQLIEDFKNTFSDSVLNQTFGFGKYTFLEAIEEMINRQPQIVTDTNVGSKWIPCSERLPSVENGEYMICKESGVVMMCSWTKKGWNTVKRNDGTYGETYRFNNVTAWQPLPESYKE